MGRNGENENWHKHYGLKYSKTNRKTAKVAYGLNIISKDTKT